MSIMEITKVPRIPLWGTLFWLYVTCRAHSSETSHGSRRPNKACSLLPYVSTTWLLPALVDTCWFPGQSALRLWRVSGFCFLRIHSWVLCSFSCVSLYCDEINETHFYVFNCCLWRFTRTEANYLLKSPSCQRLKEKQVLITLYLVEQLSSCT